MRIWQAPTATEMEGYQCQICRLSTVRPARTTRTSALIRPPRDTLESKWLPCLIEITCRMIGTYRTPWDRGCSRWTGTELRRSLEGMMTGFSPLSATLGQITRDPLSQVLGFSITSMKKSRCMSWLRMKRDLFDITWQRHWLTKRSGWLSRGSRNSILCTRYLSEIYFLI